MRHGAKAVPGPQEQPHSTRVRPRKQSKQSICLTGSARTPKRDAKGVVNTRRMKRGGCVLSAARARPRGSRQPPAQTSPSTNVCRAAPVFSRAGSCRRASNPVRNHLACAQRRVHGCRQSTVRRQQRTSIACRAQTQQRGPGRPGCNQERPGKARIRSRLRAGLQLPPATQMRRDAQ